MEMNMATSALSGLLLWISFAGAISISCVPYPSVDFTDVAMKCSGPRVTELPRYLPKSLKMLVLSETAITSLDNSTFRGRDLEELTTLVVTGGQLDNVGPHAFSALPALMNLNLSHNDLDRIDALSFENNKQLRVVDLSHNRKLRHLPEFVSSSIASMYVDHCDLQRVDVAAVKGITTLKVLSVSGNWNLNCESDRRSLKQALPALSVTCGDSWSYHRPHPPIEGRESPPPNFKNDSQATIHLIQNYVENTASHIHQSLGTSVVVVIIYAIFISLCCL